MRGSLSAAAALTLLGGATISVMSACVAMAQPPTTQPPTATEVFILRDVCAKLANKLKTDQDAVGWNERALIRAVREHTSGSHHFPILWVSYSNNYDVTTNRCYVQIDWTEGEDNDIERVELYEVELYDGQTQGWLADAWRKGDDAGGTVFSAPSDDPPWMFRPNWPPSEAERATGAAKYDAAKKYIDVRMGRGAYPSGAANKIRQIGVGHQRRWPRRRRRWR